MKLSVSLQFTRTETFGRTPWSGDKLVARPLPVHKYRKTHTHTQTLNIHALSGIRTHDPGFRASEGSVCLRRLGYRDRHWKLLLNPIMSGKSNEYKYVHALMKISLDIISCSSYSLHGRCQWSTGLWHEQSSLFENWNRGFESHLRHGCLRLFCACIGSGLATGWSLVQGVLPALLGLRNWSETKRSTDPLYSKVGATGKREIPYTLNWDHGKEYRGWIPSTTFSTTLPHPDNSPHSLPAV
jgi:hypothetical protein